MISAGPHHSAPASSGQECLWALVVATRPADWPCVCVWGGGGERGGGSWGEGSGGGAGGEEVRDWGGEWDCDERKRSELGEGHVPAGRVCL